MQGPAGTGRKSKIPEDKQKIQKWKSSSNPKTQRSQKQWWEADRTRAEIFDEHRADTLTAGWRALQLHTPGSQFPQYPRIPPFLSCCFDGYPACPLKTEARQKHIINVSCREFKTDILILLCDNIPSFSINHISNFTSLQNISNCW